MASRTLLKQDTLGTVALEHRASGPVVVRRFPRGFGGWVARRLAAREAAALERLRDVPGLPRLVALTRRELVRTYVDGQVMHCAQPTSARYFRNAALLLRRMHRAGVAHNDLAKEANWLCLPADGCTIIDFQLASCPRRRGRWFRLLAREDLRHMLKHKRHYTPETLTARERAILATPGVTAIVARRVLKPPYVFVTRRLLGWPERDGPEERQRRGRKAVLR